MTPLAATEAERLTFEAEMLRLQYFEAPDLACDTYGYTDEVVTAAWLAWAAARASQPRAALATAEPVSCECGKCEWRDYYAGTTITHHICACCGFKVPRSLAAPDRAPSTESPFIPEAGEPTTLHQWARTEMCTTATVLQNLGDARNATIDKEDIELLRDRLAYLFNSFVETGIFRAPSTDSAALVRDAARYRFMMSFQDGGEQPEEILMMWRKVIAEHRLTPTRADYELAIDTAIAASMPQKEG